MLNRDPGVHLRNLKSTPEIEEVATKCIECGFCEPVCPSRNVTTTPRQRIVIRREMARQPPGSPVLEALLEQFEHEGIPTCAVDGSCMHACPVAIDTGKLIKGLRRVSTPNRRSERGSRSPAATRLAERLARGGLRVGRPALRAWRRSVPAAAPGQLPFTVREGAAAVYMPACINRIFGNDPDRGAHPTVPDALVAVSRRAGMPLWIPDDVGGHCCGTPWSSKGFERGQELMAQRISAALARWSDGGTLPVVIDATSCSHGLISEVAPEGVEILDSIAWVHDHLLERSCSRASCAASSSIRPARRCISGSSRKLAAIAAAIADEVVVPASTGCCGMAGDRGWLHPELPQSALRELARELEGHAYDACVSSNRTCEVALREVTGRPYASFVLALEELTR